MRDGLRECRELLEDGEPEAAADCYKRLKESCSDCGLPESLELALEGME